MYYGTCVVHTLENSSREVHAAGVLDLSIIPSLHVVFLRSDRLALPPARDVFGFGIGLGNPVQKSVQLLLKDQNGIANIVVQRYAGRLEESKDRNLSHSVSLESIDGGR
mmetsp:Transcript_3871/g.8137  ORF Transcript_3871/g.8137 Transcript_3871/m.8137 type:complete len:109 (+) Transcript_3871:2-328(+)